MRDREAVAIDNPVGIDVAEPGHPDGQLHANDIGRDFDYFFGGRFLFLFRGARFGRGWPRCSLGVTGRPIIGGHIRTLPDNRDRR